jgi:alpha-galactosidase
MAVGPTALTVQDSPPAWLRAGEVTLPGRVLAEVGLPAPLLAPAQAALFTVEA